jgi:hypothetical protein
MPGGEPKSLGLSLCLPTGLDRYRSELEQGKGRWTLMNLTTFSRVSYSAPHIVTPGYGKRVQVPRGPAAVYGDETCECHCLKA